jgi:poly-gamma-glutamate synthesis protein (capsule biosynthesis protein)
MTARLPLRCAGVALVSLGLALALAAFARAADGASSAYAALHAAALAPTPAGAAEPWPWAPVPGAADRDVAILLMGDTNIQQRADPADAYRHVLPTLRAADLRFANLEMAFFPPSTDPAKPDNPHKIGWAHSDPSQVRGLVAAGIDGVGFASNVVYPLYCLQPTLDTLRAAGIPQTGSGATLAAARHPLIIERTGVKFGFLQTNSLNWPESHVATEDSPGVNPLRAHTAYQPHRRIHEMPGGPPVVVTWPHAEDLARLVADVRELRPKVDVLVMSMQWGLSSSSEIADYQRTAARAALDAGADLVFGHGPHKMQAVEVHRGKPIFYSLGNFVFDWFKQKPNPDGLLLRAVVRDKRLVRASLVPLKRDRDNNPVLLDPAAGLGAHMAAELAFLTGGDATLAVERNEIVVHGLLAAPSR